MHQASNYLLTVLLNIIDPVLWFLILLSINACCQKPLSFRVGETMGLVDASIFNLRPRGRKTASVFYLFSIIEPVFIDAVLFPMLQ